MEDVLFNIFKYVTCGSTYKSAALVCRAWYKIINLVHPDAASKFADNIDLLIKTNNEVIINMLYDNPALTWRHIVAHPEISWDYKKLSYNKNITPEIVFANTRDWNIPITIRHDKAPFETIKKYPDIEWDYFYLVENKNVTLQDILSHPNDCMEFESVFANQNISISNMRRYFGQINDELISLNNGITWADVLAHNEIDWCFDLLSGNPNITIDIVLANPHLNWDFELLSTNSSITMDIIRNTPHLKWDYIKIFSNPNITWDMIEYPQVIEALSKN